MSPGSSYLFLRCGRSRRVTVVGYSGRGFGLWWEKNAAGLARCANLDVVELAAGTAEALVPLLARGMDLQCLVQEGEVQLMGEGGTVAVAPIWRQRAGAEA